MNTKEYEKNLIESIIESVEKNGGKDLLSSIVLTGSFGRYEPTYSYSDDGTFKLKSDVEIALIYNRKVKKSNIEELISKVSKEFDEDLNLMPIDEKRIKGVYNFNHSLFIPKYKTIFTYDLFNGSYTIYGKDFLKTRKVGLEEVDLYEDKRIVANRICELEYLRNTNKSNENLTYLEKQWKGKVLLAIVSAWLILNKQYVTSYHGQYDKILENKKNIENKFGKTFIEDYFSIFEFLRKSGKEYDVSDENLRNYVQIINEDIMKLNKIKVNSLSRKVKYFFKYLKTERKFGLINFENNIIQSLIDEYASNNKKIEVTSSVWHGVLY